MGFSGGTYTRTDGVRSGSDVFVQQKNASINVTASLLDTEAQDMANALSTCVLKDGTQIMTADLPMNSKKITGLAAGIASRTNAATTGDWQDGTALWGGTSGGSANAQTITLSPAITNYATGMLVRFIAGFTNTGAVTLNANSVSATAIKKLNIQSDPYPGDIQANAIITCIHDGTYWRLLSPEIVTTQTITPAGTTQGTATLVTAKNIIVNAGTAFQGIVLPTPVAGQEITIASAQNVPIHIYPASGAQFLGLAVNLPLILLYHSTIKCQCQWQGI